MPDIGFKSVGRGRPLAASVLRLQGRGWADWDPRAWSAQPARPKPFPLNGYRPNALPKNYKPLPRDLFTSPDFYADKALWSDKRYFRCNSPQATRVSARHPGAERAERRQG